MKKVNLYLWLAAFLCLINFSATAHQPNHWHSTHQHNSHSHTHNKSNKGHSHEHQATDGSSTTPQHLHSWCGTDWHYDQLVAADPSIATKRAAHHIKVRKMIEKMGVMPKTSGTGPPQIIIPVVIHVMHACDNRNIS